MTWNATYPLSSTGVSASVGQITTNLLAVEDLMDIEHYTFGSSAGVSGSHRLGNVSTLLLYPMIPVTGVDGAIYIEEITGEAYVTSAGSWVNINTWTPRCVASRAITGSIQPGFVTQISLTANSDSLTGFASNIYTLPSSGFYLVRASARLSGFGSTPETATVALAIFKGATNMSTVRETNSNMLFNLQTSDIIQGSLGDQISLVMVHTFSTSAMTLNAYLEVTRN